MPILFALEGGVLIEAGASCQHRRWIERYLNIMDAPGPGRLRGRGPTHAEMLTAARQLKRNDHPVTQVGLIEQMGLHADPRRVRRVRE